MAASVASTNHSEGKSYFLFHLSPECIQETIDFHGFQNLFWTQFCPSWIPEWYLRNQDRWKGFSIHPFIVLYTNGDIVFSTMVLGMEKMKVRLEVFIFMTSFAGNIMPSLGQKQFLSKNKFWLRPTSAIPCHQLPLVCTFFALADIWNT